MASMQAWGILSLASCRARVSRLFSRARHSASTSNAKRSSKDSAIRSGCPCCSVQAVAMVPSLRTWSCSSVGAVSMERDPPLLVVVSSAQMFVSGVEGELPLGLGGEGEPVEAVLEDGVDVAVGARLDGAG